MKELQDGAVEGGRHVLDMARAFDVLAYLFESLYFLLLHSADILYMTK